MVPISGSGTWGADAPASDLSAAGESWSFSFEVVEPLDANPTSMVSNFHYLLGGVEVTTPLDNVEFFATGDSGLFDLNFADGNTLNFYGPPVVTDPGSSLIRGAFGAAIDINFSFGPDAGGGRGIVTIGPIVTVPEPSSLAVAGLGLMAVIGLALRAPRGLADRQRP